MTKRRAKRNELHALIASHLEDRSHQKAFPEVIRESKGFKPFEFLAPKQRACYILSIATYSSCEIAEMLSIHRTTVQEHLRKAKIQIQEYTNNVS